MYFFIATVAGKFKMKVPVYLVSANGPNFWIIGGIFLPKRPQMTKGGMSQPRVSLIRARVSTVRLSFKDLIAFLKIPRPTTAKLGITVPHAVEEGRQVQSGHAQDSSLSRSFHGNQRIVTKHGVFIFRSRNSLEVKYILHISKTKFKTHIIEEKYIKLALMKSSHREKIAWIQQECMDFLFTEIKDHTC